MYTQWVYSIRVITLYQKFYCSLQVIFFLYIVLSYCCFISINSKSFRCFSYKFYKVVFYIKFFSSPELFHWYKHFAAQFALFIISLKYVGPWSQNRNFVLNENKHLLFFILYSILGAAICNPNTMYNVIQYTIVLHTSLTWCSQNINENLKP